MLYEVITQSAGLLDLQAGQLLQGRPGVDGTGFQGVCFRTIAVAPVHFDGKGVVLASSNFV